MRYPWESWHSPRHWAWSWPRTRRRGSPRRHRPALQTAAPPEREADVRAIADLLASFVEAYNAKDAKAIGDLFTPDAEIEDEEGEVTRGRDAIVERFSGIFKEDDGDRLAVDTDSLRFLGTDIAIEEGTATLSTGPARPAEHEPLQRDLRPPGRPLAPRQDPRRAVRGGLPARAAPGTRLDARRVGQRERRRDRDAPPASGPTTATSCSASSTSRSRAVSP